MRFLVPSLDAPADSPYLFRELFGYVASPLATGQKCQPGPGEWVVDAGTSTFSVDGTQLAVSTAPAPANYNANKITGKEPIARFNGLAMTTRFSSSSPLELQTFLIVGYGAYPADSDQWLSPQNVLAGADYYNSPGTLSALITVLCGYNTVPPGDDLVGAAYEPDRQLHVLIVMSGAVALGDHAGFHLLIERDSRWELFYRLPFKISDAGPPYVEYDELYPLVFHYQGAAQIGEIAVYKKPFPIVCLASDAFLRAPGTTLGSTDGLVRYAQAEPQQAARPWTETAGNWQIVANASPYYNDLALVSDGTPAGKAVMATIDAGEADTLMMCSIESGAGTRGGVCFRLTDENNFWCVYGSTWTPRYTRLCEVNAGVEVVRATVAACPASVQHIVFASGQRIGVYGGVGAYFGTFAYESSFNQSATRCGVLTFLGDTSHPNTAFRWSNFTVYKSTYPLEW